MDTDTIRDAINPAARHKLLHRDSAMVAAGHLAGRDAFRGEDPHIGHVVDGRVTLVDRFLS